MAKEKLRAGVAAYLILTDGDKVLLSKRKNARFGSGLFSLVAGHIENNETPAQTAIREAKEEVGIDVALEDLRIAHIMYRQRVFEDDVPYIDFYLQCERWQGKIQNLEPEKCDELRWVPMGDLPSETLPYIRQAIGHAARGEMYSEFGW